MKVIVNRANIKKEKNYKIVCPYCGSELEYEEEDLYWNFKNDDCGLSIDCPCCGDIIIVDKCSPIEYPKAFYHFGDKENCEKISDEEIKQWIKQGIRCLEQNKGNLEEWVWYTGSGDTKVVIYRYDGDEAYTIDVCKNYWTTDIGYEEVKKFIE